MEDVIKAMLDEEDSLVVYKNNYIDWGEHYREQGTYRMNVWDESNDFLVDTHGFVGNDEISNMWVRSIVKPVKCNDKICRFSGFLCVEYTGTPYICESITIAFNVPNKSKNWRQNVVTEVRRAVDFNVVKLIEKVVERVRKEVK